jgi:hypothetical protein
MAARALAKPSRQVSAVHSLDALAADPGAVYELSKAEVSALLMRALAVVGTLQGRATHQAVLHGAVLRGREGRVSGFRWRAAFNRADVSEMRRKVAGDAFTNRRDETSAFVSIAIAGSRMGTAVRKAFQRFAWRRGA